MSDIHQWRRMIPLSRPRSPQILVDSEAQKEDTSDKSERSSILSTVASMPDLQHPSKRHSRPKLLTRASQYFVAATGGRHLSPLFSQSYFNAVKPEKNLDYADVESIIGTFTNSIASNFTRPLSVQSHGPLLRIFEAYRLLINEKTELVERLAEAIAHNNTTLDTLEGERKRWKEDELNYKDEIKRLEIIIASGKTGLSEVTMARQQSLIRRGKIAGTIRKDGSSEKTPRGITKNPKPKPKSMDRVKVTIRSLSPSHEMSLLSESLSIGGTYLSMDMPIGTMPPEYPLMTLANVELPRQWAKASDTGSWGRSAPSTRSESVPSDDCFEDFSSTGGDMLPDEVDQQSLTTQAIEHVAKLIANTRGACPTKTMELLERCIAGEAEISSIDLRTPTHTSKQDVGLKQYHETEHTRMRQNLAKRRGGDGMKIETENIGPGRPFSFFAGDDTAMSTRSAPLQPTLLYRAESSPALPTSRWPSMIPSPILDNPLARRRREDSSSSLITAFQRSPCESLTQRTPSGASSRMSGMTAVRNDSRGHRLVDELNSARNKGGSGGSVENLEAAPDQSEENRMVRKREERPASVGVAYEAPE